MFDIVCCRLVLQQARTVMQIKDYLTACFSENVASITVLDLLYANKDGGAKMINSWGVQNDDRTAGGFLKRKNTSIRYVD